MNYDENRRQFLRGAFLGVGALAFTGLSSKSFAGVLGNRDICDRVDTVKESIEDAVGKVCGDVSESDLALITDLQLPHIHLPGFRDLDFVGLTNLKSLKFYSLFHKPSLHPQVEAISAHAFDPLSNLEVLDIHSDTLGNLPDGVFSGLVSLKTLNLRVSMTRLPESLLTLPKIETVKYNGNGLPAADYERLKEALGDKLKP